MMVEKLNTKGEIWLSRINLIYFFAITFLAFYFGKERVIFCDGANALYDMFTQKTLYYGSNRIATVINYILPYFTTNFGFSLKITVYALILNYTILPIFVFAFLRYKQQSIKYELSFLVTFTFFNWQTYYYPIHDYWTGFYLFFILYRLIDDTPFFLNKKLIDKIIIFLIIFILLSHINTIISLFFLFFYLVSDRKITNVVFIKYCLLLIGCFLFKILFLHAGYENGFLSLSNLNPTVLATIPQSILFKTFFQSLFNTNFNFLILLIFFYTIAVVEKKNRLLFAFSLILFTTAFILFIVFKDYEYTVYAEGQFKSTTIVLSIIAVSIFLSNYKENRLFNFAIFLNYLFSILVLINGGNGFAEHYQFISKSCKEFKKNVFLTSKKNICPLEFIVLPKHSLIINQLENNSNTCIFANVNNDELVAILTGDIIKDNSVKPKTCFTFPESITYLDADSMQFDIAKLNLIFRKQCVGHYKRIKQE